MKELHMAFNCFACSIIKYRKCKYWKVFAIYPNCAISSALVLTFNLSKYSWLVRSREKILSNHSILKPLLLELLDRGKVCQVLQVALGFALCRYLAKFVLCLRRV